MGLLGERAKVKRRRYSPNIRAFMDRKVLVDCRIPPRKLIDAAYNTKEKQKEEKKRGRHVRRLWNRTALVWVPNSLSLVNERKRILLVQPAAEGELAGSSKSCRVPAYQFQVRGELTRPRRCKTRNV